MQDVLKGYEKSLLVKIIGSTAHVSLLFNQNINDSEVENIISEAKKHSSLQFTAKGLAYSGTVDISTGGCKSDDSYDMKNIGKCNYEELKSQSPEVFFKGMVYSNEYTEYLSKILIGFDKRGEEDNTKTISLSMVYEIYVDKKKYDDRDSSLPYDWDGSLKHGKPIALSPSLYREVINPYNDMIDYVYIRFSQAEKNFGINNRLNNEKIEFEVVSTLDTPASDETIPIVTAYETIKYLLFGTSKGANNYNYVELFLVNPMDAKDIANQLKQLFYKNAQIFAWSDKYASEMALINGFNLLLFSVMFGTGISIGLLLSSLLDITVRKKRRQLSILLSMGASEKFVKNIFIYYSLFLGTISYVASVIMAKILEYSLWLFINADKSSFEGNLYLPLPSKIQDYILALHSKLQRIPNPENMSISNAVIIFCAVLIICFVSSYRSVSEGLKINPIEGLKEY